MKEVAVMTFYAVDLRDRAIVQVSGEFGNADNMRVFLVEAESEKQAWAKASRAFAAISNDACGSCRHRYCSDCDKCSVAKQSSDYWICHRCGELNRRVLKRS
jgi:hypothetical protein